MALIPRKVIINISHQPMKMVTEKEQDRSSVFFKSILVQCLLSLYMFIIVVSKNSLKDHPLGIFQRHCTESQSAAGMIECNFQGWTLRDLPLPTCLETFFSYTLSFLSSCSKTFTQKQQDCSCPLLSCHLMHSTYHQP